MDVESGSEMAKSVSPGRDLFVEGLVCGICRNLLNDHRILPCGHAFCSGCLTQLQDKKAKETEQKESVCPIDGSQFDAGKLEENDVLSELVKARRGWVPAIPSIPMCEECEKTRADIWCEDCSGYYCKGCQEETHIGRKMKAHRIVSADERTRSKREGKFRKCADHQQDEQLHCTTCDVPICFYCYLDNHQDHKTISALKREDERRSHLLKLVFSKMEELRGLSFYKEDLEISIREKQALIRKKEEEVAGHQSELAQTSKGCSLIEGTRRFFDLMIKDLPLTYVSEPEVKIVEEQLLASFGLLKKDHLPPQMEMLISIKAWGGGGGGGGATEGKPGLVCSASFNLLLGDELIVVVGQGGMKNAKFKGYKTNGGEGSRWGATYQGGQGGGSSHVILKRTGDVILGAGGGGGGNSKNKTFGGGGGGTRKGKVGQGGGNSTKASNGGGTMGSHGFKGESGECSVMMEVKNTYVAETSPAVLGHRDFGHGGRLTESGGNGAIVLTFGENSIAFSEVGEHTIPVRRLLEEPLFPPQAIEPSRKRRRFEVDDSCEDEGSSDSDSSPVLLPEENEDCDDISIVEKATIEKDCEKSGVGDEIGSEEVEQREKSIGGVNGGTDAGFENDTEDESMESYPSVLSPIITSTPLQLSDGESGAENARERQEAENMPLEVARNGGSSSPSTSPFSSALSLPSITKKGSSSSSSAPSSPSRSTSPSFSSSSVKESETNEVNQDLIGKKKKEVVHLGDENREMNGGEEKNAEKGGERELP